MNGTITISIWLFILLWFVFLLAVPYSPKVD
jgi:hypothetical protein